MEQTDFQEKVITELATIKEQNKTFIEHIKESVAIRDQVKVTSEKVQSLDKRTNCLEKIYLIGIPSAIVIGFVALIFK